MPEYSSLAGAFSQDIDVRHAAILSRYPTSEGETDSNLDTYPIQDRGGFSASNPQKLWAIEGGRFLPVVGKEATYVTTMRPPRSLMEYFSWRYDQVAGNILQVSPDHFCEELNANPYIEKVVVPFPYRALEKHAIPPEAHHQALSKLTLHEMGIDVPRYKIVCPQDLDLRKLRSMLGEEFYLKTPHGQSGEGNAEIKGPDDIERVREQIRFCRGEVTALLAEEKIDHVMNYGVQAFLHRDGTLDMIGYSEQKTEEGNYLGSVMQVDQPLLESFRAIMEKAAEYLSGIGYFGFVSFDVLEDAAGDRYVIDGNMRFTGSTPLYFQLAHFRQTGKTVAELSMELIMREKNVDETLGLLQHPLQDERFSILTASEQQNGTHIVGMLAGGSQGELREIERELSGRGLVRESASS